MKYSISLLPSSNEDLLDIKAYLAAQSENAALLVVEMITARIATLAKAPRLYPVSEDDDRFRRMVAGEYLVFYTLDEAQQAVEVHHIWHARRNIRKALDGLRGRDA